MLRCILTLAFSAILTLPASAQDLVVLREEERVPVQKVDDEIWVVKLEGEDYFILQRSVVDSLTKRIEQKDAIIERHERVLAAQEALLEQYEAFEIAATAHVDTMEALVEVADSLYIGYRSLYRDARQLLGLSEWSVHGGLGTATLPGDRTRVLGIVGIGYHDWWGHIQIGRGYRGVAAGVRLPIGF